MCCLQGKYNHGKIHLSDGRWIHLVSHECVSGEKVGQYLCSKSGHSNHKLENVWNRYDWCEFRALEESNGEGDSYGTNGGTLHFASANEDGTELSRLYLDPSCIEGDWNYGLRLVDVKTSFAFAYDYMLNILK